MRQKVSYVEKNYCLISLFSWGVSGILIRLLALWTQLKTLSDVFSSNTCQFYKKQYFYHPVRFSLTILMQIKKKTLQENGSSAAILRYLSMSNFPWKLKYIAKYILKAFFLTTFSSTLKKMSKNLCCYRLRGEIGLDSSKNRFFCINVSITIEEYVPKVLKKNLRQVKPFFSKWLFSNLCIL